MQAFSIAVLGYSGVETLAVTAGETGHPRRVIPQAVNNVTWRIGILYIGSILVMLIAFPWTALTGHHVSPYVLLFSRMGIGIAATVVNLIIISSGLSSSNTGLYGGSRMLFSLARQGVAPGPLTRLSRRQIPDRAVLWTAVAMSLGVVLTYVAPNSVYLWISGAAAFAAIWTWGTILVSQLFLRWRQSHQTPRFPVPLWPFLPGLGLVLLLGTLLAIMVSPGTRVSVWSGVAWLAILWGWWLLRGKHGAEHPETK